MCRITTWYYNLIWLYWVYIFPKRVLLQGLCTNIKGHLSCGILVNSQYVCIPYCGLWNHLFMWSPILVVLGKIPFCWMIVFMIHDFRWWVRVSMEMNDFTIQHCHICCGEIKHNMYYGKLYNISWIMKNDNTPWFYSDMLSLSYWC